MSAPASLGPYHLRLDWLTWFAALYDEPRGPWVVYVGRARGAPV
ncbi:MAG TPA: hypothetical protein VFT22_21225 [Kofleriaceae bacterium]|nr:hypothetical protein [Kofleriaceae bacterium]